MSIIDDVRRWAQVIADSRCTLLVHPADEQRAREALERLPGGALVDVQTSPVVDQGHAYLVEPGTRLRAMGLTQEDGSVDLQPTYEE